VDDETAAFAYVRTRDPQLFRLLVERHHQRVLHLVASLLGPHADRDAEEVCQDVFVRACARLDTFRGDARFGTWLYRLAYNCALEHRRHARIIVPHLPLEALENVAADDHSSVLQEQRRHFIAKLLEQLPDLYRTVINLRYWLDYSVEEIATMLDTPVGTVKSYLFRARAQLKAMTEERDADFLE
jgi:RNA polymerase sigma-70 factor (ECF subfamily)